MCGIMGYIGNKDGYPVVIDGLKKLEYRGYDSAGVAIMNGSLSLYKKQGKVNQLEAFVSNQKTDGNIALGHTRWATHGEPNDINAHPHTSGSGRLVMVHNGIIENYDSLKCFLTEEGFHFQSDTDSEVLVQYIEWYQKKYNLKLTEAIRRALCDIEGSFAIMVLDTESPDRVVVAKKDNPLVFGLCEDEFYVASDAGPISTYTQEVIYLKDGEIAELRLDGSFEIIDLDNNTIEPELTIVKASSENYDLEGYDSYMLKEIFNQPASISACLEGRIDHITNEITIPEIDNHKRIFTSAQRIIIVGCGTSWHAGLIGEYMIESLAHLNVEVEYASEFRYRNPIINENDIVIAISQSGETADTLAALKLANEKGAFTYSLVNTFGSTIARNSDVVSYLNVGVEIGVASTKAFTAQVCLLMMIALKIAKIKGTIKHNDYKALIPQISQIPTLVKETLQTNEMMKYVAKSHFEKDHALFLGRGINFPVALEGALKLKEISYIHAEGYPAAEMKHGPIALIDENMPVFVIATNNCALSKMISNVQEIKSRKGQVIFIKEKDQQAPEGLVDYMINIPSSHDIISPILASIALQLFSYHAAKMRGCNIDQPRNLAKSVTVE